MPKNPLIAHVIHHLVIGGLENGLINLINHMPENHYRHAIICIDDYSDFRNRILRKDVEVVAMHKKPGNDFKTLLRLWSLFRRLKPSIVHTRNISGLDALIPAALAGVECRIHGEHGRDVDDLDGKNRKLRLLRRLHRPFVNRYVALSKDLMDYLHEGIGISEENITHIYNGVDIQRFNCSRIGRALPNGPDGFAAAENVIIGTVGRLQAVKNHRNLVRGFAKMLELEPKLRTKARLIIVGDGPLRSDLEKEVCELGVDDLVWLTGARNDIPNILRCFDVFSLPSLAEGISNTLLEAMATGLPAVASCVGGNTELIVDGVTGKLVPASDSIKLALALQSYVADPELRREHGSAARVRAEEMFSLDQMVQRYVEVYDNELRACRKFRKNRKSIGIG